MWGWRDLAGGLVERRARKANPWAGESGPGVAGAGGRTRGFALTPGGGLERQALPAWYRGVWCPQLRPLKKLGALEFSVCKALPLEVEASKTLELQAPLTARLTPDACFSL